jgi:hypothetical protein
MLNFLRLKILVVGISAWSNLNLLTAQIPPDEDYVNIETNGHLYLKGERIRFWGAIGSVPGKSYEENEAMVKRLKELGFNMFRNSSQVRDYRKGDKSIGDLFDHFLYFCKKEGIYVWYTGLNRFPSISANGVNIVNDPQSADEWKKAVGELGYGESECFAWDDRILKYRLSKKAEVLNRVNQYTGLRYVDDPVFAVFELTNEEWWFHRIKQGQFLKLPEFFLKEL